MESLVQWYAENGNALWATIISFMVANGAAIVGLVIGVIRAKLTNNSLLQKLADIIEKQANDYKEYLEDNKEEIIAACDANAKKRIEAMKEIADAVNTQNEALEEYTPTDTAAEVLAD